MFPLKDRPNMVLVRVPLGLSLLLSPEAWMAVDGTAVGLGTLIEKIPTLEDELSLECDSAYSSPASNNISAAHGV